ncbi:MAG: short chain dehydrogenase, partial [Pseudomonadota bacterium]
VNALWPRNTIATAAVQNLLGGDAMVQQSLKPEVMGDAAHVILSRAPSDATGQFFVDDEVLASVGVTDLTPYKVNPDMELFPHFFVDPKPMAAG